MRSEPVAEGSISPARKKEKSQTLLLLLFRLVVVVVVVQLLRVIVRVNGIAECKGEGTDADYREGRIESHDGLCTFYEINSYVRHISGWLIVTALATEINSRD